MPVEVDATKAGVVRRVVFTDPPEPGEGILRSAIRQRLVELSVGGSWSEDGMEFTAAKK